MTKNENQSAWPVALLLGTVYLTGGLFWFLSSLGLFLSLSAAPDPISSMMLVIVSIVFLSGVRPLRESNRQGYAYIAVGIFLAGVLFFLQLLIIGTNFLGWILGFEDWIAWTIFSDITPTVWLFIFIVFIFIITRIVEGNTEGSLAKHILGDG
ncbi:MAG: hypothetical protein ACXADC_13485 [Candidatus Thorarchaeota archaeon]|jgi:hypothetical protein